MNKILLKLWLIIFISYVGINASAFIPKSSSLENLLHNDGIPHYVNNYFSCIQPTNEKVSREHFIDLKMKALPKAKEALAYSKNSFSENGSVNPLLQVLKNKQSLPDIQKTLQDQFGKAYHELGLTKTNELSTDALSQKNSFSIRDKNDIHPSCNFSLYNQETMSFFKKILHYTPKKNTTNIVNITNQTTNPITMPGAAGPTFGGYKLFVSDQLPLSDILYTLAHEQTHADQLDVERLTEAKKMISLSKKLFNRKELNLSMAELTRACEYNADTQTILQLNETNPALANALCEYAIVSNANGIALEAIRYLNAGLPVPETTLVTDPTEPITHPTTAMRLLLLAEIYKGLKKN